MVRNETGQAPGAASGSVTLMPSVAVPHRHTIDSAATAVALSSVRLMFPGSFDGERGLFLHEIRFREISAWRGCRAHSRTEAQTRAPRRRDAGERCQEHAAGSPRGECT